MDWVRQPDVAAGDPSGLRGLLDEARRSVGGALSGTRFVHDARQMLEATRAIEARALGSASILYVGFQDADRLAEASPIYDRAGGWPTQVIGYGIKEPDEVPRGMEWVEVPDNPDALENQWFLVTEEPEPVGLVGYETSEEPDRRQGDAGSSRRSWEGFLTRDPRLVAALVQHLEGIRRRHGRDDPAA